MATAISFTDEFTSPLPAPKLFKGLILDADVLLPKLIPQAIKSIEILQGDGGPGTIKLLSILEGSEVRHLKHRVDVLDKEKMVYEYTLLEGDLGDKLDSVTHEIKLEAEPSGGSKGTNVSKYYPKPGAQITEDEFKAAKEKALAVLKAIEAYLLANPDA